MADDGYRTALLSSDPAVHGLLDTAPRIAGMPILLNVPAFAHRDARSRGCCCAARARAPRANNIMVVIKLLALGAVRRRRRCMHIDHGELHAVRAERLRAASTRARPSSSSPTSASTRFRRRPKRRRDPQRNLPIGILGGLAICTVIYVIVGIVLTGHGAVSRSCAVADPLAQALDVAGLQTASAGSWRSARSISMTAVLLVFQYGQPRIFFAMARDGLLPAVGRAGERTNARAAHRRRCSPASSSRWRRSSATRTRSTTSPTSARCSRSRSSASACWCCGTRSPTAPRPFRVPFVWVGRAARRRRLPVT